MTLIFHETQVSKPQLNT